MAYIKELKVKCVTCDKRATKEVFDRWNGSCGKYCTDCARRKLKEKLAQEKET